VWSSGWGGHIVRVLVMRVVRVDVLMLQRFVQTLVLVLILQMQPHAQCHESGCHPDTYRERLAQEQNRNDRGCERPDGKASPGPCRSTVRMVLYYVVFEGAACFPRRLGCGYPQHVTKLAKEGLAIGPLGSAGRRWGDSGPYGR